MVEIHALRSQEYSTNLELLSQQMTPKLAMHAYEENAAGSKAFRMLSQIDSTEATERTVSAKPAINIDVDHDGRWVYPRTYDWGRVVDDIDLQQMKIKPQGAYTRSAIAAMNRKQDDLFLEAYFGTAKTDETGSTSTTFPAANQVAVTEGGGGSATGLNVEKMRAAQQLLLEADVDIDMEEIYMAVSPQQHDDLLAQTLIVSTDFNDRPVLVDGRVRKFLNMNIIISTRLTTDTNSYRRLPVWVKSGMGKGSWKNINGVIRKRPDLQGNPDYVEASMTCGFTRLEEAKCIEIKCSEA